MPATKPAATGEAERFLAKRGIAFERRADGSLFVPGDLTLDGRYGRKLRKLPDLSMVDVSGDFFCFQQMLTTLEGAPRSVAGNFTCSSGLLISLKGAPRAVGGSFNCEGNRLTTLEHAPQTVGGHFSCRGNLLTSLKGAPAVVGIGFDCSDNQLTRLEHAPRSSGKIFNCATNQLESLKGAPRSVSEYFNCSANRLASLRGAPRDVSISFNCGSNRLRSLRGMPLAVLGVWCEKNDLVSLEYAPAGNSLYSDFGAFGDVGCPERVPIPEELRRSPASRSRHGRTRQEHREYKIRCATVLHRPVTIRPPLRFRPRG